MLTAIHLSQFKSYQQESLLLSPLTLMIGANASGKSNAIEAFRFLCWLAQGQKLDVLRHQVQDSEQVVRGRVRDLGYLGSDSFKLGCSTDDNDWNRLEIELALRDDELHIAQESIRSPSENFPLYRIEQASQGLTNTIRVAYNNFARGGKKPQLSCTDQITVLNQLASSALFEAGHKKAQEVIPEVTGRYQKLLANTLFLDPVPSQMREASYPDKRLKGDCSNLSGVLYRLCQDSATKDQVIAFIRSLPEQDVTTLNFQEGLRGARLVELVESFGGQQRRWTADLLSDGTLRVLAIAAALLSAEPGSTVVIEEVDNGIHPSRARQLLNTMREQAQQRGVRLLLSTHNPALMDALPDAALGDVVFCYRCPETGASKLIRLMDLHDFPGLLAQGPLGELVTSGTVDRFVKSPETPEQKKQKALAWLARMQGDDE
ncbi:AAA family ATPase [Oceanobacter antarcticus]|uniref:AAA family ATPase n=1 Tax=Oceanobacter antarcticus TaxID=3133425 RepID=A0ABW8NHF9_9GAMM